ncbi:MAG: hypothetical protein NDJ89_07465 [Oligoflexia bacterium]|nr:hypothetical protein [Oligoflexia bacterium]
MKKLKLFLSTFVISGAVLGGSLVFATQGGRAEPLTPLDLFLPSVDRVSAALKEVRNKEHGVQVAMQLRGPLFTLESLLRIYKDIDEKRFKKYKKLIKGFEDYISHTLDRGHGGPEAQKLNEEFKAFLIEERLILATPSRMEELRQDLISTRWPDAEGDLDFVVRRIAEELEEYHGKTYDLTKAELGMHELRRDVRWFSYYAKALNGLIRASRDSCPLSGAAQRSPRRRARGEPCQVSACLTDRLSEVSSQMSSFKYGGSSYEERGQPLPRQLVSDAEQVHRRLIDERVLPLLAAELRSCGNQ